MILRMLGLSILMILSLSLAMACGILTFVDDPKLPPRGVMIVISLSAMVAAVFFFRRIQKLNSTWQEQFRRSFEEEPENLLAHWRVSDSCWKTFVADERQRDLGNGAVWPFLVIGVFIFFVMLVASWSTLDFTTILLFLGLSALIPALVYGVLRAAAAWKHAWRLRQKNVNVWLRPDGLRINEKVIMWNQLGSRLEEARLDPVPDRDHLAFQASVRVNTGKGSMFQIWRAPVPSEARVKVNTAAQTLSRTYGLPSTH